MTEKELRDKIILTLYNYKDKSNIEINSFCAENNILNNGNQESIITSHVANEICALSCGEKGVMSPDTALADVVAMVVPYNNQIDN